MHFSAIKRVLLLLAILGVSAIQVHAQYIHPFHANIIAPKHIHSDSFDYILRTEPIPDTYYKSNSKISDRTLSFTDFNASTTEDFDALNSLIQNFDFGITQISPTSTSNSINVLSGVFLPSTDLQVIPRTKDDWGGVIPPCHP